ncbi:MAG: hypothetical protein HUJ24_07925 [Rhodobacteraceae bacterium]|nr:hypothetical protein [Paracoccaceae bacterium]
MKSIAAAVTLVVPSLALAQADSGQIRLELAARCVGLGEGLEAEYAGSARADEMAALRRDAEAIRGAILAEAGTGADLAAAFARQTDMRGWAQRQAGLAGGGTVAAPAAAEALSSEIQVCQALRAAYPDLASE